MEVGYETYGDTMDNITFQNITIVHNFHKAAISIHNCDDADITNVTYKNITLEDGQMLGDDRDDGESDFLIDFTIAYNMEWTQSADERGTINGVNIENVKVLSLLDSIDCRMNGESETSLISNVSIKGLEIEGKQVTNEEELKLLKNEYTSNITISTLEKVTGATIYAPYKLDLGTSEVKSSNVDSPAQEGMIVPSFSVMQGELSFIGSKVIHSNPSVANKAKFGQIEFRINLIFSTSKLLSFNLLINSLIVFICKTCSPLLRLKSKELNKLNNCEFS